MENQIKCYLSVFENLVDGDDINEFMRIIQKNCDLLNFFRMCKNGIETNFRQYQWLPLSTSNVERSFSSYKSIMNDLRSNLRPETIFKIFLLRSK